MSVSLPRALLVCAALACSHVQAAVHVTAPDARTADGGSYYGPLRENRMHGRGRIEWPNGAYYEGSFDRGLYSGRGVLRYPGGHVYRGNFRSGLQAGHGRLELKDGAVYTGEFRHGLFHGKGRYERKKEVYEGDFVNGEFTGNGVYTSGEGTRHEGRFLNWRPDGPGRFVDRSGSTYEGEFANGELSGHARVTAKGGASYEGELDNWRPEGTGTLRLPNGDVYEGQFSNGAYHGKGTLTYAKPQADGRTQDSGIWRYGSLRDDKRERQSELNVETALYNQRALLDKALGALLPSDPSRIHLYLLAIGGDGSQEVFRREVEFVQRQFARRFYTDGRSVALINSRSTVATVPMATVSSIRESLNAIASRMDRERDILFVFLTSHGSETHELTLSQENMRLRGLRAKALADMLAATRMRWKVVVVSACYSGGFIDALKDESTLVMTAARHDRRSFGCSDDNDFTYFGRAFFEEALPASDSFVDAFGRAEAIIRKWEAADAKKTGASGDDRYSLPQISAPAPVTEYLRQWWSQLPPKTVEPRSATLSPP